MWFQKLCIFFLLFFSFSSIAQDSNDEEVTSNSFPMFRNGEHWNFGIELGYRWQLPSFFSRMRVGYLWVREPYFISLGPHIDWLPASESSVGINAELMHLWSGLWVQMGPSIDFDGSPGINLGFGWSVLGFELEPRFSKESRGTVWSYVAKVRIPIGIILYGIKN